MALIEASEAGGKWAEAVSWVGGVEPKENDDVIFGTNSGAVNIPSGTVHCRSVEYAATAKNGITMSSLAKLVIGGGSIKADGYAWRNRAGIATVASSGQHISFGGTAKGTVKILCNNGSFGEGLAWNVEAVGGTVELTDKLVMGSSATCELSAGTFLTNGFEIEAGKLGGTGTTTRVLTLEASVIKLTGGSGTLVNFGTTTGLTLNRGTSKIEAVNIGGGLRSFEWGAAIFYDFVQLAAETPFPSITWAGSPTFHNLTLGPGFQYKVTEGKTTTVENEFTAAGTEAKKIILISSVAGKNWKLKKTAGTVSTADWLELTDSHAEGAAEWYAGAHSKDNGGNEGWKFAGAPHPVEIPLAAASSSSSASLSLVNPAKLSLESALSASSASLSFVTAIRLILQAAAIESAGHLTLHLPPEPPPPQQAGSYIERLRERPPLRLNIDVETPLGAHYRMAWDEADPGNVPMGLGLSNVMPGGYERCSFTLERDTRLSYPDLAELSKITVRGAGGVIAWQGRLEKTPDTGGFQEQVAPEAVGYQAALEDDSTAREVFVEQLLASWEPEVLQHKIELLEAGEDSEDASVGRGAQEPTEASTPALITQLTGAWARRRISSGWYDAKGIAIGLLYYAWKQALTFEDPNWEWLARLASDEAGAGPSVSTGNLRGKGPGSGTLVATALSQTLAEVKLVYPGGGGADGQQYPVFWTILAIVGAHGLPLYGTNSLTESKGVLCSDAVAYAIGRWAAEVAFTTGPEGTIQPTSFIIDQLSFLDPTSVAEMLKQSARFELPDWAVWDGPTFYLNERGEGGRQWRARVGPAQLREAGPQVARLWNGVIVTYQDVTGRTRTVGPPGSGAELESEKLVDTDPENPLNELGIKRIAPLSMGTSTAAGATQVGAIFLREQARLDTSGEANIVGWVEDTSGILSPAWAIRSGDTIAFVDASDSSARRIVHANYDESTRACQLQLDQPPDSLTAILERLSASVAPLGF